jgi:hypothetical protein
MIYLLALLPTIFMFYILIELFPYTGLGRIIALPFIFILNFVIIILGIILTNKLTSGHKIWVWFVIVLLTVTNTVTFYPQEFRPSVPKQVWYSVTAIKNYDNSTLSDIDLQKNGKEGAFEQYVVALYKYRQKIPLDGSFHIYGNDYSPPIRNIDEIPQNLYPHHKLIWWYLEKF